MVVSMSVRTCVFISGDGVTYGMLVLISTTAVSKNSEEVISWLRFIDGRRIASISIYSMLRPSQRVPKGTMNTTGGMEEPRELKICRPVT